MPKAVKQYSACTVNYTVVFNNGYSTTTDIGDTIVYIENIVTEFMVNHSCCLGIMQCDGT